MVSLPCYESSIRQRQGTFWVCCLVVYAGVNMTYDTAAAQLSLSWTWNGSHQQGQKESNVSAKHECFIFRLTIWKESNCTYCGIIANIRCCARALYRYAGQLNTNNKDMLASRAVLRAKLVVDPKCYSNFTECRVSHCKPTSTAFRDAPVALDREL